ncbi:MAG: HAMP domain-containing sensor histidine kinase [Candidatus Saccharimonas sp.]
MFKSATIKLMVWYVLFVVVLSLVFSGVLYQFSSHELSEALGNQYKVLVGSDHDADNQSSETTKELDSRSQHLIQNLVYFNILILFGAIISSYILARRTLRPIEIAHRAQIRFSAEASHELRTPLTAMKADTESRLMQRNPDAASLRQTLEGNLADIERLERLTEHLLEISRYKSRSLVEKRSAEASLVIGNVVGLFKQRAKEKNIKLKASIDPLTVAIDAESLSQLVTIIIDNAIKYSKSKTNISIQLERNNKQATLTIIDQGIGIHPDDLPHIYEYFYRSKYRHQSREKIAGYGLGLPLAKGIVELYNGAIDIKSTEGNGTTVSVTLPLA